MSGNSAEFLRVKFFRGDDTQAKWKCSELERKKTLWPSTALSSAFLGHMMANLLASRWISVDGSLYSTLVLSTTEQNGQEGWRMNLLVRSVLLFMTLLSVLWILFLGTVIDLHTCTHTPSTVFPFANRDLWVSFSKPWEGIGTTF